MPFLSEAIVPNNVALGSKWNIYENATYRPLPDFPRAYSYNILVLGEDRTAILDIPHSDYVSALQSKLTDSEAWEINAKVRATFANRNISIDQHRNNHNSAFWTKYSRNASTSTINLFDDYTVELSESPRGLNNFADESWVILAMYWDEPPLESVSGTPIENQTAFLQAARMYNLNRAECKGKWKLTKGNLQLNAGNLHR